MDFTKGSITSNMIKFALPLMAGNLLQQMYNLAYALSAVPVIGVRGIWVSVPIGWVLADLIGGGYMLRS